MDKIVDPWMIQYFVESMVHGWRWTFEECTAISKALESEGEIPKKFWKDEKLGLYGIMRMHKLKKEQVEKIREETVEAIIKELYRDDLEVDNYARLFHGLTLLQVPKDNKKISNPEIKKCTQKYTIAYNIWLFDDGEAENSKSLLLLAWQISEKMKEK